MGQSIFSGIRFTEILKTDPQTAFEYRLKTMGEKIPETYGIAHLDTSMNDLYGDNGEILEEKLPEDPSEEENNIPHSEESKAFQIAQNTSIPTDDEGIPVLPPDGAPLEVVIGGKMDISGDISKEGGSEVKTEYTRDTFKKLLDAKEIPYFKGAKDEQLAELCIKNNLI